MVTLTGKTSAQHATVICRAPGVLCDVYAWGNLNEVETYEHLQHAPALAVSHVGNTCLRTVARNP